MNINKVLRSVSIFAFVLAGFVAGTAFAAPNTGTAASAAAAPCQVLAVIPDASMLTQMSGTYLPGMSGNSCSSTDASASAGASNATSCATVDESRFAQMTGSYLPGGSGSGCVQG